MEGSYTVEAAFLMPLILGIVFVLLYTLFILHDRVILQANINNMLLQEAEKEEKETVEEQAFLENGLWCMRLTEYSVKKRQGRVTGRIRAEAEWTVPVLSYFLNQKQCYFLEKEYSTLHPEMVMRFGFDFFNSESSEKKLTAD